MDPSGSCFLSNREALFKCEWKMSEPGHSQISWVYERLLPGSPNHSFISAQEIQRKTHTHSQKWRETCNWRVLAQTQRVTCNSKYFLLMLFYVIFMLFSYPRGNTQMLVELKWIISFSLFSCFSFFGLNKFRNCKCGACNYSNLNPDALNHQRGWSPLAFPFLSFFF